MPPDDGTDFSIPRLERELEELYAESSRAQWVYETFITSDTKELSTRASTRYLSALARGARSASSFNLQKLSGADLRKATLLRTAQSLQVPADPKEAEELTRTVYSMLGAYSTAKYQPRGQPEPLPLEGLSRILETSRDPSILEDVWAGWHRTARPIRADFCRYVELGNRGARELGFSDMGAMWRSGYDEPGDSFRADVLRLWEEVRPLYTLLHAYVRKKLVVMYGPRLVDPAAPVPCHLFGNMWAQTWTYLLPDLLPPPRPGEDLSQLIRDRQMDPKSMVQLGERFFRSIGFDPLPPSFWERSMFTRPRDRDVVCHASAWTVERPGDVRLKMCIEGTEEDIRVIHHELGHNFYELSYRTQPHLFRAGAHDGFHEAVGDTIVLSMTPEYYRQVGLVDGGLTEPDDTRLLLIRALDRVAFLPFALLVDTWRWDVFSGAVAPDQYNSSWWELRRKYQGVVPPAPRDESDFDPGAKMHVAGGVPYLRYFLAAILQYQFHQALARIADWPGPLHRFSVYGKPNVAERLREMLAQGASRPWTETLEILTGSPRMEASSMREFFTPLATWLKEQVGDSPVGW